MPLEALRYAVTPVGLHYLLIHYDVPAVEADAWRLTISGERELELSLDDLRSRPAVEQTVTMECAGNGRARLEPRPVSQPWILEAVGTARWRGTALRPLLEEAGIPEGTVEVLLTGLDRGIEGGDEQSFQRALPLDEARREEVLLAYEMNGAPLPPQHGFPLRLVVPGWYGMTNVKWLSRIEFLDEPFAGYQQSWSYRVRQSEDEEGVPLGRMQPRSLLVPPGIPEFLSRDRTVEAGEVAVEGRAWSGLAPIASVEVSDDGGSTWASAELEPPGEPWAWRGWSYRWDAEPGEHLLCSRARDEAGNEQPVEPPWNLGGYANNSLQTVRVTVTG
jgi:DMSO/TMAO reductase YedYZ molybdopterin-dependent catalytic subunit